MLPPLLAAVCAALLDGLMLVASYISNSVFPQPLSSEEEAKLLKRMAAGDREARNILVERNLRLVAHIVKKFDNTGEDADDLISIGTIGLIKAINTFDPNKQTRLATYAARCIENEILMHLRSSKKTRSEVLLYDPIGADKEGNEITLLDILGTEPDIVLDKVEWQLEHEKLRRTMQRLTRRERRILELRYGLLDGVRQTQRDISRALGISRSYVSRIEKRAITKLQREMLADG
ncbi:MAG: RNA polymerase sporulation sigma factor SigK [Bacillota bacterium]|nr:RNA polymerase sporulation sigma factor SigK [Bacillota bacterium]REJ36590.1 MAG: RNA polymerase sporulation sigma factor SigK [Bacillota bacterium]